MTSAQGTLPALYVLIALFCIPPILSLRSSLRRYKYVRGRHRPGHWPAAAALFSALALAFNLTVIAMAIISLYEGGTDLGGIHAIALGLSWICFWIWVFVAIYLRRRKRRVIY